MMNVVNRLWETEKIEIESTQGDKKKTFTRHKKLVNTENF